MDDKPVIVRVKFGKGKYSSIKEYRFKTRKRAEKFISVTKYNPKYTTHLIMGD